jgi:hypothetical protein
MIVKFNRMAKKHSPLQDPPKCNLVGIFGLKKFHLATLGQDVQCAFFQQVLLLKETFH